MRVPCGSLQPGARKPPDARDMTVDAAFALLADLVLREVDDLGAEYFEAELQELLPLA